MVSGVRSADPAVRDEIKKFSNWPTSESTPTNHLPCCVQGDQTTSNSLGHCHLGIAISAKGQPRVTSHVDARSLGLLLLVLTRLLSCFHPPVPQCYINGDFVGGSDILVSQPRNKPLSSTPGISIKEGSHRLRPDTMAEVRLLSDHHVSGLFCGVCMVPRRGRTAGDVRER